MSELNVAADDAFINSSITGANGGLIIVAADDPSMHSSQNEQDSRFLRQFCHDSHSRTFQSAGSLRHGVYWF
jgi:hypothetical protein